MKRQFLTTLCLWVTAFSLQAQKITCDCRSDLTFTFEQLKESASYKDQVEEIGDAFEAKYKDLLSNLDIESAVFDCFKTLNALNAILRDNHTEIYGNVNPVKQTDLHDSVLFKKFSSSATFKLFPSISEEQLDSIVPTAKESSNKSLSGLFTYKGLIDIVIYEYSPDQFRGVVIESKLKSWRKQEVILETEKTSMGLKVTTGRFIDKALITFPDKFKNGRFLQAGWSRSANDPNFSKAPFPKTKYKLDHLSDQIGYLKAGSFSTNSSTLREALDFYKQIENELNSPYLILDLRDNPGGGDKTSKPLLKILKRYAKNNQIYTLTNFRTKSNAEQFTVKLKKLPNVTTLGDATNGTLSYGWENTRESITPSGYFIIYPTNTNHNKYLPFEQEGVAPDVFLRYDQDWIEQTKKIILKQKKTE